jgi:hypothetical protein
MKPEHHRAKDLKWDGHKLRLKSGRLLATVEPDSKYEGMFRVRLPNGHLSDMANITLAKDAAIHLALANLNRPASHTEAVLARSNGGPVSEAAE